MIRRRQLATLLAAPFVLAREAAAQSPAATPLPGGELLFALDGAAATTDVQGLTVDTHGFPEFHGAWLSAA